MSWIARNLNRRFRSRRYNRQPGLNAYGHMVLGVEMAHYLPYIAGRLYNVIVQNDVPSHIDMTSLQSVAPAGSTPGLRRKRFNRGRYLKIYRKFNRRRRRRRRRY